MKIEREKPLSTELSKRHLVALFEMSPERGESHSVLCIFTLDGVSFSVGYHLTDR